MIRVIILLFLILLISIPVSLADDDECWVFDDIIHEIKEDISVKPLVFFTDSLPEYINKWENIEWNTAGACPDSLGGYSCRMDTVGYLKGHLVLDLFYEKECLSTNMIGKAIVVKKNDNSYYLLYVFITEKSNAFFNPSTLYGSGGNQMLKTSTKLGGQNNWSDDRSWFWNYENDCPCKMKYPYKGIKPFNDIIPFEYILSTRDTCFKYDSLIYRGPVYEDRELWWKFMPKGRLIVWYRLEDCAYYIDSAEYISN